MSYEQLAASVEVLVAGNKDLGDVARLAIQSAQTSAEKAYAWADAPEDSPVAPGKFSALHWAIKAQALAGSTQTLQDNLAMSGGSAMLGFGRRSVQDRLSDTLDVMDYIPLPTNLASNQQIGMEDAVQAAKAQGKDLYWPIVLDSTWAVPDLHSVRHYGPGGVRADGRTLYLDPKVGQINILYVSPTGTGDGVSASRPLAGIGGALSALSLHAPLTTRWEINGAAGRYKEALVFPNWFANADAYLAMTFPANPDPRADAETYLAILDGNDITATQGLLSGGGNRMSISNLGFVGWYDKTLGAASQVRRAAAVSSGSYVFFVNCGFKGNGLANISALPGGTAVITGGNLDGARYSLDNTGGRMSLSASPTTYTLIQNAYEYGLYQKHQSSTVMDYTEFRSNGHGVGADGGAAIFCYKSNASVDTRGVKFNKNNNCWNVRGGFIADNPGIPDVYGTGENANNRRYLMRGGGMDDIQLLESNRVSDITRRFGGGATTSATDAVLLADIARLREGYFASNDQSLRIRSTVRAVTGAGLFTPVLRHAGGIVTLGTYRVVAGAWGHLELLIRPTTTRNSFQVLFTCNNAVQNLGFAVGQTISTQLDLPNVALTLEMQARAEAGGTATMVNMTAELSG